MSRRTSVGVLILFLSLRALFLLKTPAAAAARRLDSSFSVLVSRCWLRSIDGGFRARATTAGEKKSDKARQGQATLEA